METGGTHIIKRHKRHGIEAFSKEKLQKSIVAACLSAGAPHGQAEIVARHVAESVEEWLEDRPEVTSSDLRLATAKQLKKYHADAGYLYEQHRMTI